ncbi:DUF58 domain-containing protein [Thermomonas hydrothermalis]|uniref:DUF58 domain-containing protein n=1 Tax=Thermomonas hydrothermalis TaxID=213588 RepID=A0A1M4WGX6_9GAMM|nr:DUF58 domain-containing protein [Thermomonas hydrothermalis]MCL6618193.1 DUF58 domain-containing protein [Thermomonas hydrothermalis]SHE80323.1 Protein of unknown function DUF58 [Thermomonas hydrothermalis]
MTGTPAITAAANLPADGVRPSLAELIALHARVQGRHPARRGAYGWQGHALSTLRGRGMEYAESREYAPGDDARHIDWRLTARSGRLHTKLFQAERERLTLILADTAPALYFGTRVRFKSVQAARAGAVMAWLAQRDGDRVAALRGSHRDALVAPAGGRRGVLRVLDALVRWYATPAQTEVDAEAGLGRAVEHALRLLRPGARVLVLADPASIATVAPAQWAALARFDASAVLLTDPLEREPPQARRMFALADGSRVALALETASVRQRWQQTFAHTLAQAQAMLQQAGVRVAVLSSEQDSDAWLGVLDTPRGRRR